MGLGAPSPPDAGQLAGNQSNLNQQAGQYTQDLNTKNLDTAFGSNRYTNSGLTQYLSPDVQKLVGQYQNAQEGAGGAASSLGGLFGSLYGQGAPDFNAMSSPLVKSQMDNFQKFMEPTFNRQESNLAAKLHNQGISSEGGGSADGNDAYANAWRSQMGNENQANISALMQFEPQAFQQAIQSYGMPIQTLTSLLGLAQPGAAAQGTQLPFTQQYTPQVNVQPANYIGAREQQFQQQQNQYQNFVSGLGTIGSGVAGLFGGPAGFGSAIGGLFGLGGSGAGGGGVA